MLKRFKALILLLSISSIFFISYAKAAKTSVDNKFGGTLRLVHIGKDPQTFNSWVSNDASSSQYAQILFEGLTINDPDTNEVTPHIAKSFESFNNGKKIIVKIRDDVFWTDGHKLDADDVVFTWNTLIRDAVAISSLRDLLLVEGEFPSVKKIDQFTVSFETKKVFAPFLEYLGISIAPKHDIERFFEEKSANSFEEKQKAFSSYLNIQTAPEKIVSTGAFKLKKIKYGERIEFKRNPLYFKVNKKNQKLPYLDRITYSYVQDSSAAIFKFLAGESHILSVTPENAALIKSLEKKYNFTLYDLGPSTGTNYVWFNMSKNVKKPKHSWFNSKAFRKAVSYAIDRESIVNNVYQGLGEPLFTAMSLKSPFLNEKLKDGHKRDINQAKAFLKNAGFKFKEENSKLKLYDANDNKVEFDFYTNASNKEREMMATIIANNLQELGIKVNFKLLEFNNFVGKLMAGQGYDMGLMGLTGGYEPNGGSNVWKSSGRLHFFDPRAVDAKDLNIRDWEHRVDQLFEQGVQSLDFQERKKIYDEFQEIIHEELPLIHIASPIVLTAASNKLGGIRISKYGGIMPYLDKVFIKKP